MSHRTKHRMKSRGGGRRLAMLQRKLDLSDEQVDTLRERFAEHHKQGRKIVRDVLDEQQTERFDRHLQRRRGHRHGGPNRSEKA